MAIERAKGDYIYELADGARANGNEDLAQAIISEAEMVKQDRVTPIEDTDPFRTQKLAARHYDTWRREGAIGSLRLTPTDNPKDYSAKELFVTTAPEELPTEAIKEVEQTQPHTYFEGPTAPPITQETTIPGMRLRKADTLFVEDPTTAVAGKSGPNKSVLVFPGAGLFK
jgi:hypothetical protein